MFVCFLIVTHVEMTQQQFRIHRMFAETAKKKKKSSWKNLNVLSFPGYLQKIDPELCRPSG